MSLQRLTCESETGKAVVHVCNPCSDKELGRVRGLFLFSSAFKIDEFKEALKATTADEAAKAATILEEGITSGTLHLIPETSGSYNGGEPEYGDGYGDESQRLRNRNHEITFKDPSYAENEEFWSEVEKSHWYVGWRTDKLIHIGDKPASVVTTDPIEDSIESDVTWNGTISWKSKKKATILPLENIAKYFEGCWEEEE